MHLHAGTECIKNPWIRQSHIMYVYIYIPVIFIYLSSAPQIRKTKTGIRCTCSLSNILSTYSATTTTTTTETKVSFFHIFHRPAYIPFQDKHLTDFLTLSSPSQGFPEVVGRLGKSDVRWRDLDHGPLGLTFSPLRGPKDRWFPILESTVSDLWGNTIWFSEYRTWGEQNSENSTSIVARRGRSLVFVTRLNVHLENTWAYVTKVVLS